MRRWHVMGSAFVVAAAAGFAIGFAPSPRRGGVVITTTGPAHDADADDTCSAEADNLKRAIAKQQLALFAHASHACPDTADLTRTIATLEGDLFQLQANQRQWDATNPPPPPPPPPPELPPRYAPELLEGAFAGALAEAHIDASVRPFFCPSLPCPVVVVPHAVVGDNAFMAFRNSPALAAFVNDILSCSTVSAGSGQPVPRDAAAEPGVSFMPYSLQCALVPHELRASAVDAGVPE